MKKILAWIVAAVLLAGIMPAVYAEETAGEEEAAVNYDYEELTVAVTTPLTGNFFTNMWGNASSDLDIRTLIHGYNLIEWNAEQGMFVLNKSVVSGGTEEKESNGDITYTLSLYPDLKYSDGTRITAWDYAFSMLLSIAPEMKEIGANVKTAEYVRGYKDYVNGRARTLKGLKVNSAYSLSITINASYLPFFYELGLLDCVPYPISVIAPGAGVKDDGNGVYLTGVTAEQLRATILDEASGYMSHPTVTSGAYKLVSYENGTAKLEANPNYKGDSKGRKPQIQKITVVSLGADEQAQALADGSITVLNRVSSVKTNTDAQAAADANGMLASVQYMRAGLSFIGFNAEREIVGDLKVRQAIAYLADRDRIIGESVGENGMKTDSFYGQGQWMYQVLEGTLGPMKEPAEDADEKTKKAYEAAVKAMGDHTLDDIRKYELNADEAARLLDEAGWNLNEAGEAYDAANDKLRYRKTDDGLVPLKLTLAYAEGSAAGSALESVLVGNLAEAGIELSVEAIPAKEVLDEYYRNTDVKYDMLFLATNFDVLYDPAAYFTVNENGKHVWRMFGLEDEGLYAKAVDMRRTQPGDVMGYCVKWLAFQVEFAEKLPALPIYTNEYTDYYAQVLHGYEVATSISWPQAIAGAYLGEVEEQPAEGAGE